MMASSSLIGCRYILEKDSQGKLEKVKKMLLKNTIELKFLLKISMNERVITGSLGSICSFSIFCTGLHHKIFWRITYGDSNIFANLLKQLLGLRSKYVDFKHGFIDFCERFQIEFLLLYGLSKDETSL